MTEKSRPSKPLGAWLERLRGRLVKADELQKADLIFVLAGHRNRKVYGARLFRDLWAPCLLMSTGDPRYIARVLQHEVPSSTLQNEKAWRQIQEAAALPSPREGQFFACLNGKGWSVEPIGVGWFGTLSEIKALSRWLEANQEIRSLLVVSDGMHLKRLRMCCRRLLPRERAVYFIMVPRESFAGSGLGGPPPREGLRQILLEWAKVIVYGGLLPFCKH